MFLHVSVILSTGGGVCLSAYWEPPRTRHPPDQAPPAPGAHIPPETATVAESTLRTGMHSCLSIYLLKTR